MIQLTIRKERVGPVRGRHPWIFSGAFVSIPNGIATGSPVKVVDPQGQFLAQGYFNSYSQIAVRVWSWNEAEEVNDDFFEKRIRQAFEMREKFVASKETDSFRLIYGEGDFLPGLVVDKYADYLSVQFHNRGIEAWKEQIIKALIKILEPKGIYERSDVGNRARENSHPLLTEEGRGAAQQAVIPGQDQESITVNVDSRLRGNDNRKERTGLLFGEVPEKVKILENGYKFLVNIAEGQKTGFFLDQRDKRQALIKYCKDKNVLNCFSYTGGFSVYALGGGANRVVSVDVSEPALQLAEENIKLNKFSEKKSELICADVKEYLTGLLAKDENLQAENFDVIVVDPPAFIKDRHKIKEGIQGYRKVNEMAIRLLPPGGILVSASCSAHLSLADFRYMLSEAAGRAGRTLQILETYTHGIDHPELVAFTEGEYLKCVFAVVN